MDKWTKFYRIWSIIAILSVVVALCGVAYFLIISPQANIALENAQNKLANVIENQRAEAKLHPEDTNLNRSDFLDIVESESEYGQTFIHVANAEFTKALYIALAALLLATISLVGPLFKKEESKKVLKGSPISASQGIPVTALLLTIAILMIALFKNDESKKNS